MYNDFLSFNLIKGILDVAAEDYGFDVKKLLQHANIPIQLLEHPFARITYEQLLGLIERVLQYTQDEALGLHIGKKNMNYGRVGEVMFNSSSLRQGLELCSRYQRVAMKGINFDWFENGDKLFIRIEPQVPEMEVYRGIVEVIMTAVLTAGRNRMEQMPVPLEVSFEYETPSYLSKYEEAFPCPIRFNQPHNQMIFNSEVLDYQFINPDPTLFRIMLDVCEKLMKEMSDKDAFTTNVKKLTEKMFDFQFPNFEIVARTMGTTPRTLRRKLNEEHASFQGILNEIRVKKATYFLNKTHLSMMEISNQLGFANASAFHRAFKKWTGKTPGEYRNS
ncbi:AraC family transcriptional regulator [Deltaproteobacteria bacterium TL4]